MTFGNFTELKIYNAGRKEAKIYILFSDKLKSLILIQKESLNHNVIEISLLLFKKRESTNT